MWIWWGINLKIIFFWSFSFLDVQFDIPISSEFAKLAKNKKKNFKKKKKKIVNLLFIQIQFYLESLVRTFENIFFWKKTTSHLEIHKNREKKKKINSRNESTKN